MSDSAGPFALIGLILFGMAILWARQVVYRHSDWRQQDAMRLVLSLAGSLFILTGVLGAVAQGVWFLAPVACVMVLGISMLLVMRYRAVERRALLRCVAVAASKGIPLDQAVRSFAYERTDELGYRSMILADALQGGMTLPDALSNSKTRLPVDALLAMRVGYETGTLGPAVTRIARQDDDLDLLARSLFEKYLYLTAMIVVMFICVSFFVLKIAPVLERMFDEFSIPLPPITQWNLWAARELVENAHLILPVLLPIMTLMVLLMTIAGAYYLGILPRDLPGISYFSRRFDAAIVMRAYALAVGHQWPLNKTTWMLARLYPKRSMRGRLAAAGRRVDNGEDWCTSLYRSGIIARADWSVLQAAQRVGNLEWALDEMSQRSVHRLVYRWRLVINLAFPLVLLLFGLVVAFFVVGFFAPLADLIKGLA